MLDSRYNTVCWVSEKEKMMLLIVNYGPYGHIYNLSTHVHTNSALTY